MYGQSKHLFFFHNKRSVQCCVAHIGTCARVEFKWITLSPVLCSQWALLSGLITQQTSTNKCFKKIYTNPSER